MQSSTSKTCRKCGSAKPATTDHFERNCRQRDGLATTCKLCRQRYDRQRDPIRRQFPRRQFTLTAGQSNYRAAQLGISGQLATADLIGMWTRQRGACFWCECDIRHNWQLDHIRPLGTAYFCGDNAPDNVCLSCPACNRSKHDMPPEIYAGKLAARGKRHPLLPDGVPVQMALPLPDPTDRQQHSA